MAPRKKTTKTGLVFWRPSCTIVINGKTYEHGDSVDDWPAEALERHADKLRKALK